MAPSLENLLRGATDFGVRTSNVHTIEIDTIELVTRRGFPAKIMYETYASGSHAGYFCTKIY